MSNTSITSTVAALNTTSLPAFVTTTNLSNETSTIYQETPEEEIRNFWIGLILAVTSACFTGSSFILKKKGLLNVSNRQGQRAGMTGWFWHLIPPPPSTYRDICPDQADVYLSIRPSLFVSDFKHINPWIDYQMTWHKCSPRWDNVQSASQSTSAQGQSRTLDSEVIQQYFVSTQ